MTDSTIEQLHPFASTLDLDGIRTDREIVQDIAYDGEVVCQRNHAGVTRRGRVFTTGAVSRGGNVSNTGV